MTSSGVNVTRGAGVVGGEPPGSRAGCSAPPEIPRAEARGAKGGVRQLWEAKLFVNRIFFSFFFCSPSSSLVWS